jgi:hypothetical protein
VNSSSTPLDCVIVSCTFLHQLSDAQHAALSMGTACLACLGSLTAQEEEWGLSKSIVCGRDENRTHIEVAMETASGVLLSLNLLCDEHLLNCVLVKLVHKQER